MSEEVSNIVRAPWTDEQVSALNRWQSSDYVHPYTCGSGYRTNPSIHPDGEGKLVATRDGWMCPNCDYKQDWAWAGSFNPEQFDIGAMFTRSHGGGTDIISQPHEQVKKI